MLRPDALQPPFDSPEAGQLLKEAGCNGEKLVPPSSSPAAPAAHAASPSPAAPTSPGTSPRP
jgi:hypothetical protein